MSPAGAFALAAIAGLNPWLVMLIVAGLATFTHHAPLAPPFDALVGMPLLAGLGALLGVEVVASKVARTARLAEWITTGAAAAAGALVVAGLAFEPAPAGIWPPVAGAALALATRVARRAATVPLNRALRPFGHIATGITANVLAGAMTAALFAVKP